MDAGYLLLLVSDTAGASVGIVEKGNLPVGVETSRRYYFWFLEGRKIRAWYCIVTEK